jgi:RNA polymerase sigma factor (sigma-70 family)
MTMLVAPRLPVWAMAERETVTADAVDVVSFDGLYAREAGRMLRLAYLMLGSHAIAEEAVQDAFAKVFEKWTRIEVPGAYLRTCVVNNCRRLMRRSHMERDRIRLERETAMPDMEYLNDALAKLSPKQRAAIVLRYFDDRSEAEIAEALRVRPGTVKSLLSRGLGELREMLPQ